MKNTDKIMVVVPAKKESKRFPGKNFKRIMGKTLVELALDRGKEFCNDVFLIGDYFKETTLDLNLLPINIVFRGGEEINNKRAIKVIHKWLREEYLIHENINEYNTILVTLPTSPLCKIEDLKNAYNLFLENDRKTVISVTETRIPQMYSNNGDGELQKISGYPVSGYKCNGAVWVCDIWNFLGIADWFDNPMIPYKMPPEKGVDIDTRLDYLLAVSLYNKDFKNENSFN